MDSITTENIWRVSSQAPSGLFSYRKSPAQWSRAAQLRPATAFARPYVGWYAHEVVAKAICLAGAKWNSLLTNTERENTKPRNAIFRL